VEEIDKNNSEEIPQEDTSSEGSGGLNSLLKILSFGVIGILAYLILTTSLKTCGKHDISYANGQKYGEEEFDEGDHSANSDTSITASQDLQNVDTQVTNVKELDTISSTTPKDNQKPTIITPPPVKPENNPTVIKPQVKPSVKPNLEPTNPSANSNSTSVDNNNSILVIAGNYIQESNAKELQKKLGKAGIKNTEVIVFDFSEFHTVIVGRYKDLASAKKMVSTLKSKGFESYTHQKRKK
jgi:cell division septation protein DedD